MRNWVFVKIITDQDVYGWGEATVEWKTRAVVGAIEDLKPLIVGKDPRQIKQNYQIMTKHAFWKMGIIGMSAISLALEFPDQVVDVATNVSPT